MSFQEVAKKLEILEYPAELDDYYPVPMVRESELCSIALIDRLQERFGLFGTYYSEVIDGYIDLESDPVRKACLDAYSLYIKDHCAEVARCIYCPQLTGTKGSYMLGLLIHLPSVENVYDKLVSDGLSHEKAVASLRLYCIFLREVKEFRHGFLGYTPDVARWLTYCSKGEMYYPGFGGFYYQAISLPKDTTPYLLKNKTDGQILPVFGDNQKIHRSGIPLGSQGMTDETGAFETTFQETDDAFVGHPVRNCRVSADKGVFDKQQWELVFAPGVDAISMHVLFEADLSSEAVTASLQESIQMARRMFPDKSFQAIYCSSWLLHPAVSETLGINSKIRKFADNFVKFPSKSGANAVFHYVFPGDHANLTELPEKSRLQKGLKRRILSGEYIHDTAGIILL